MSNNRFLRTNLGENQKVLALATTLENILSHSELVEQYGSSIVAWWLTALTSVGRPLEVERSYIAS